MTIFAFLLCTLLTHFLSCIIAPTVFKISFSLHNLSFLGRNHALNSNKDFNDALFLVSLFVTNCVFLHKFVDDNRSRTHNNRLHHRKFTLPGSSPPPCILKDQFPTNLFLRGKGFPLISPRWMSNFRGHSPSSWKFVPILCLTIIKLFIRE